MLCEFKTPDQISDILERFRERDQACLLTRLAPDSWKQIPQTLRDTLDYDPISRTAIFGRPAPWGDGRAVAIVSGGSSDAAVALEAARTLEFHGARHSLFQDVGVAGLWRLLDRIEAIRTHGIVIAVAGMEGALFSALGGLVSVPIIAVPTSIGYGVSAGGRLALESALGSCAPGLVAVNIDNGYGAACAALRLANCLSSDHG